MGVSDEKIASGFNGFAGVKRRFTKVGEITAGEGVVTVIDDYAHHPVEIRAVLSAAREGVGAGRVVGVVQPHRFTRLRDHMDDFQQAFNDRSEEHTSELQSLMRISYAVFCLKKKKRTRKPP